MKSVTRVPWIGLLAACVVASCNATPIVNLGSDEHGDGGAALDSGVPVDAGGVDSGVACQSDADCSLSQICVAGGQCALRPGACSTTADCSAGELCDISGNCVGVDAGRIDAGTGASIIDAGVDAGRVDAGTGAAIIDGGVDAGGLCVVNNGGCTSNALCSTTSESVVCECPAGYVGNGDFGSALVCTSPCANGNGGCDPNAACSIVSGAVSCECNPGYVSGGQSGTALTCANPCTVDNGNCSASAICGFADGAVACGCPAGYFSNGQFGGALICTSPCAVNNGGCGSGTCSIVGEVVACVGGSSTGVPDAGASDAGQSDAGVDAGPATWDDVTPNSGSPPTISGNAMTFDSVRGVTLMFGGCCSGSGDSGTWTWDGSVWTQQFPASNPPGRSNAALVFDSRRGVAVLFGGASVADTWEWDGTNWTQRFPTTSPPNRNSPAMAYDSSRGVTVLFGGCDSGGATCAAEFGDTWEWDGTNWSQRSPATSPSARYGLGMAYDSLRGVTVLFGGCIGECLAPSDLFADTWEWNGTAWTEMPTEPDLPRRGYFSMDYDSLRNLTVVFGGQTDSGGAAGGSGTEGFSNDTWVWNGMFWAPVSLVRSPFGREMQAMAYDSVRAETVMYGVFDDGLGYPDTWVLPSSSL